MRSAFFLSLFLYLWESTIGFSLDGVRRHGLLIWRRSSRSVHDVKVEQESANPSYFQIFAEGEHVGTEKYHAPDFLFLFAPLNLKCVSNGSHVGWGCDLVVSYHKLMIYVSPDSYPLSLPCALPSTQRVEWDLHIGHPENFS